MEPMRPARLLERAAAPAAGLSAAFFAALSRTRGKRFFHPSGSAFEASVQFALATTLPFSGSVDAIVRLSRGIGLPEKSPDVLGLAVKIPSLGQDFLLASSGEAVVSRHLLIPSSGYFRRPYSSVLPYEFDGRMIVFGGRADPTLADIDQQDAGHVARLVSSTGVRFDLTWGPVGSTGATPFAAVDLGKPYTGDVSFNPFNCVAGLKPAGALNRLRLETYERSQAARPDTHSVA